MCQGWGTRCQFFSVSECCDTRCSLADDQHWQLHAAKPQGHSGLVTALICSVLLQACYTCSASAPVWAEVLQARAHYFTAWQSDLGNLMPDGLKSGSLSTTSSFVSP